MMTHQQQQPMSTTSPKGVGAAPPQTSSASAPPPKIRTRSSNANHSLEPNPFEVSFSKPSQQPSTTVFAPPSPSRGDKPRSTSKEGESGGGSKPMLPPIAAMASPAGASDFAWAFSGAGDIASSLRSGPLSPAMLAGPQQYPGANGFFDGPSMRTGLTPDVSRTGLTPLLGSPSAFPPHSPNTAAFIAMVAGQSANGQQQHVSESNGGVAGGQAPATITPGTLTSIMNGTHAGTSYSNGANASHPPHPLSITHIAENVTSYPNSTSSGDPNNASASDAHTAANGLFLLSQAHQELAKREEQQAQAAQQQQATNGGGRRGTSRATSAANKRKATEDAGTTPSVKGAPAAKKSRNGASAAAAAPAPAVTTARGAPRRAAAAAARKKSEDLESADGEGESDDEGQSMMDMDMDAGNAQGRGSQTKKFETEEEKRKNFLERNRQAALKCRQRKKAWLNQLQAKVEYLTAENERLQNTTVSMREEITRLSAVVVAHRDCGLGGVSVARSEALVQGSAHVKGSDVPSQNHLISRMPSNGTTLQPPTNIHSSSRSSDASSVSPVTGHAIPPQQGKPVRAGYAY